MSDVLHKFDNACADLRQTSAYLLDLSEAFDLTGNLPMASMLKSLAGTISESEHTCNEAVSQMVNERFQAAQEASNNMLMAALAMTGRVEAKAS